jgi:hypothetical protein
MHGRERGASLLEVMLVLALLVIFIWIASLRMIELRTAAERTGVEHTIGVLHSALGMQMAATVVRQGMDGLLALQQINPMELLDPPPANYLGELEQAPSEPVIGSWYFNREQRELVYQLRYPQQLQTPQGLQPGAIHLQLRAVYEQVDGEKRLRRIGIEPVYDYEWIDD